MNDKYAGRCIGGPYDGKDYIHYAKTFSVVWIDGNPLREIPFKREGHYDFFENIWRWSGPRYQPASTP